MPTSTVHSHQALTVLLVEDDDIDAMAVTRMFRRLPPGTPVNVQRAFNGQDGLDQLRGLVADEVGPLLVLLDINMPRVNGHEFLAAVRADQDIASTIVFVLTTSVDPADVEAAYRAHVAGYLAKSTQLAPGTQVGRLLREYADANLFPGPHGGRGGLA